MHTKLKELYQEAKSVHHSMYQELRQIEDNFFQPESRLADKVDTVYALQKTSEMLTDIRKQIDKLEKKLGTAVCVLFEYHETQSIKTNHCSAKMKIEQFLNLPHKRAKDPEKFDRLMSNLGIAPEIAQNEAVRFHWPGYKELFSSRQADGEPLPDGVNPDDVYAEYSVKTRKLKDPDE